MPGKMKGQVAKEKLGMTTLTTKQTVYINLPKQDYIESESDEVNKDEKKSLLDKIKELF